MFSASKSGCATLVALKYATYLIIAYVTRPLLFGRTYKRKCELKSKKIKQLCFLLNVTEKYVQYTLQRKPYRIIITK